MAPIEIMVRPRRSNDLLRWLKAIIVRAAKAHTSRKITAGALVAASISGFRFVQPIDDAARIFRTVSLIGGSIGFGWPLLLLIFPPRNY
jgi:hypothetical protein